MNKCFKPEYTNIRWEYDIKLFEAWAKGMTGFPIVDAAMRQMNYMGSWYHRSQSCTGY
jgi:deoxyribodipyrimidine photo-lyase